MKKVCKFLCVILALTMIVSLAACGGGGGESSQNPGGSTEQPAGNTDNANQPDDNEPSGEQVTLNWAIWDKDSTAYWQALADGYMETHENVKIEMTDLGSNDYMTQLSGGNGEFYGIPFRSDFWVVFYNKDLFDAAGVDYPTNDMTLDQYDELMREMTSGEGAGKVYGGHYHTWRSAAFQNGTAAMVNMGSWFLATMQQYNADAASNGVEPVNFGMVKYPHPDGAPAGSTLGTVTSLGVNANSTKQEAAIDFVNWCASAEGAAVVAATGTFPAVSTSETLDIIAATEGFPDDDASKEALTTAAVYLEMPYSPNASEIETVLNTEHDAIMTGAETVDEGIQNMNEQVQAILNG